MEEQKINTHICDDVIVTVLFDYQPEEKAEDDYPGCQAEVTLNSVLVKGWPNADILDCLNEACLLVLKSECHELMDGTDKEEYERSQEEA